ncbi:MAG: ABC transporter ATP-binding protein [Chloroherpetonaceae bacterium]|nr:ABC transporter ATP-binding protein [Chloroherpetonaceae bacterium]
MKVNDSLSPVLKAVGLSKFFNNEIRSLEILKNVSLDLFPSETVSIIGKSGCGKTTLLNILATLDLPDSGSIYYENTLITKQKGYSLNQKELTSYRNNFLGFVFQFHHLMEDFTAQENVAFPLYIKSGDKKKSASEAIRLLDSVGMGDRLNHLPSQLSGGEQQRVSLCRALINKPRIIFADEPTGNLDSDTGDLIYQLILSISEKEKVAFLIVTHSEKYASLTSRAFEMKNGSLIRVK